MILTLHTDRITTLSSLEPFLAGTAGMDPKLAAATERARQAHVLAVLCQFGYAALPRAHPGLVLRCLVHTSGYSCRHLTRLVARYREHAPLGQRKPPTRGFHCRHTEDEVVDLAKLDAVHENLSGPATRPVLCGWLAHCQVFLIVGAFPTLKAIDGELDV